MFCFLYFRNKAVGESWMQWCSSIPAWQVNMCCKRNQDSLFWWIWPFGGCRNWRSRRSSVWMVQWSLQFWYWYAHKFCYGRIDLSWALRQEFQNINAVTSGRSRPSDKEGGGLGSHPDPEIRGSFEPQFGLKVRGAWAPPLDLPMVAKGLMDYAWL